MDTVFHTLHDFMIFSKGVTYLLMGGFLVGLLGWWLFLTGRDKPSKKY